MRDIAIVTDSSPNARGKTFRWVVILAGSSLTALFCGIAGLLFSFAPLLFPDVGKGEGQLGTLLLVLFFPVALLAAHSLDEIRASEQAIRNEPLGVTSQNI